VLTTYSLGAIARFEPADLLGRRKRAGLKFIQASKTWLQQWHEDPRLSHSERTLCTLIYLFFNARRFERTGELLAWPGWKTLMAEGRLSKASVYRGLKKLERLGALQIEHGRYNPQTKKRANNYYKARFHPETEQGLRMKQDLVRAERANPQVRKENIRFGSSKEGREERKSLARKEVSSDNYLSASSPIRNHDGVPRVSADGAGR
jgi:hypothetical protein